MLAVRPGGRYVDGTVGLGGHARAILERSAPDGTLIGVDRDAEALDQARRHLARFGDRVRLIHADYREVPRILDDGTTDGLLLDLGVSSFQLDTAERGFSFQADGPLDMRMDRSRGETAASVVNRLPEAELASVIYRFGEERFARRIARSIVEARRKAPVETTMALAGIVRRTVRRHRPRRDPATRTFQALRIYVNQELAGLGPALEAIAMRLALGGRMAVIAFQSLEDREVKLSFRGLASRGFRVLTRKPLRPSADEVRANPRARSARLRALTREAA